MRINEAKMIDIVPNSISHDATIRGLCSAADVIMHRLETEMPKANLFENLELFAEKDLDAIAEAEEIPWYDTSYDRQVKIGIIHDYEKFAMIIGTKAAVEGVTTNVFGDSEVEEWYEYGGQQYGFKIHTQSLLTPNMNEIFTRVIDHVKNMRAGLESIAVNRKTEQTIFAGVEQHSSVHPEPIKDGYKETETILSETQKMGTEQFSAAHPEPIKDGYKEIESAVTEQAGAAAGQFISYTAPPIQ